MSATGRSAADGSPGRRRPSRRGDHPFDPVAGEDLARGDRRAHALVPAGGRRSVTRRSRRRSSSETSRGPRVGSCIADLPPSTGCRPLRQPRRRTPPLTASTPDGRTARGSATRSSRANARARGVRRPSRRPPGRSSARSQLADEPEGVAGPGSAAAHGERAGPGLQRPAPGLERGERDSLFRVGTSSGWGSASRRIIAGGAPGSLRGARSMPSNCDRSDSPATRPTAHPVGIDAGGSGAAARGRPGRRARSTPDLVGDARGPPPRSSWGPDRRQSCGDDRIGVGGEGRRGEGRGGGGGCERGSRRPPSTSPARWTRSARRRGQLQRHGDD